MRALLSTLLAAMLAVGVACDREEPTLDATAPAASSSGPTPEAIHGSSLPTSAPTADPYQSPWAKFGRMTVEAKTDVVVKVIQRDGVIADPPDQEFTASQLCLQNREQRDRRPGCGASPGGQIRFDDDGKYLVHADRGTVLVVDPDSRAILAYWLGNPQEPPYERSFASFEGAPIGLLDRAPGCDGLLAYHPLLTNGSRCLTGVKGAVWSPDRKSVAFSRFLRRGSSSSTVIDDRWSVVILDLGSGRETEVVRDLRSDFWPFLRWNETGTHLLIE